MAERTIFITATDTGAGKTAVTALLAHALRAAGIPAIALKPVASGLDADGANEDIAALQAACGRSDPNAINLYRFAMPAAPSLAAAAEGRKIDPEGLVAWCRQRCERQQVCLIEGVGGLMVPLTPTYLVRDWLAGMPEAETMLVVPARLGAINHALLTLAELGRMDRRPRWIVINDLGADTHMVAQVAGTLEAHLAPTTAVLVLPYLHPGIVDDARGRGFAATWLESLDLDQQGR
jgi:dethiobiotin synthetase